MKTKGNNITRTVLAAVAASILLFVGAGCGSGGAPYTVQAGNLEGYVYQKAYNEGSLGRIATRVAGREAPTGYAPVEGATVTLSGSDKNVVTGADGRFYFENLVAKTYTVTVAKGGSTSSFDVAVSQSATTVANDSVGDSELLLAPAAVGSLSVSASSNCSVAVPLQANVYLKSSKQSAYYDSGMDTPLAIITDIAPGSYSVQVGASGFSTSTQDVVITEGQRSSITFSLNVSDGNAAPYAQITAPVETPTNNSGVDIPPIDIGDLGNIGGIGGLVNRKGARNAAQSSGSEPTFTDEETVTFVGTGIDCEDGNIPGSSLSWKSSKDGALGTGLTLRTSDLSVGRHKITLTATDSGGKTSTDSIFVVIEYAPANVDPVPVIAMPQNNATFDKGQLVTFAGAATDQEDGSVAATGLAWTSSRDGKIGTGALFQSSTLTSGKHTITLTATDSKGGSASTSISITVSSTAPPANTKPTATIGLPRNASTYAAGLTIFFVGGATDTEDTAIIGSNLVWTSSIDGNIGTGSGFSKNSLSKGTHTITLTATDSGGLTDTDTITLTIN